MARRTQYLKLRRRIWYFQLDVPADLRRHFGKIKLIKTTGERDVAQAQPVALMWAAEFKKQFADLRRLRQADATAGDTSSHARPGEVYRSKLAGLQAGQFDVRFTDAAQPGDDYESAALELSLLIDAAPVDAHGSPILDDKARARLHALQDHLRGKTRGRPEYGLTFSEAALASRKDKERDIKPQALEQAEVVHRLFASFVNDRPIQSLTRTDAAKFLDQVRSLDPLWGRSRHVKELSFSDIVARFGGHADGLSNKTINRYLTALRQVWEYAKQRGDVSGDSPFTGFSRTVNAKTSRTFVHFDDDDLRRLFDDPPAILAEVALVALYSGMRLGEICSLEWEDIKQADGVTYFDITEAKSEAGVRVVPVHSKLSWLLDRRPAGDDRGPLWPDLKRGKYGWKLTEDFTRHRRACGVDDAVGRFKKGFHSFRKNATRCLELARVPENEAAEILGHEKPGFTYRVYNPEGRTMKQRQRVVECMEYPALAGVARPRRQDPSRATGARHHVYR